MTTSNTTRPTEAVCPPWCAGHAGEYQPWEIEPDGRRQVREHGSIPVTIAGMSVWVVSTEVVDGLLAPVVVLEENESGRRGMNDVDAQAFALEVARAATMVWRERLRREDRERR